MRVVVALGGNALLRRGEPMTAAVQRGNVRVACEALGALAEHELVVTHGNGPQVGMLALQSAAYRPDDPAFDDPTKPIGPVYTAEEATRLAAEKGWAIRPDNDHYRRVVASPTSRRIFEIEPIRWLLDAGAVVVCVGGGGIPTAYTSDGKLTGVEAVIDKDRASGLLARQLAADVFLMATDVDAVYRGYGTPDAQAIARATPDRLRGLPLPAGSMAPKVEAACAFAENAGRRAVIGALDDVRGMLDGTSGTTVEPGEGVLELREA
jgi:carbamate kinase